MSRPTAAGPKLAGPVSPSVQDARERFGQLRLAAFAGRGFAGQGRWFPDRAGRESYAMVAGDGPCPAVLVHGGVGTTIEWAQIAARLARPVVIPDRPGFGLSDPHDYRQVDFRPTRRAGCSTLLTGSARGRSTWSLTRWAGSSRSRSPLPTPTGSDG